MIRCHNCRTNNIDGSEYCDECGVKLEMLPPSVTGKQVEEPLYEPPSAVPGEQVPSDTLEGPLPSPPTFTTSTSIPKPATPADERSMERRSSGKSQRESPALKRGRKKQEAFEADEGRAPDDESDSIPAKAGSTYVLSSRSHTDGLRSDAAGKAVRGGARATARLVIERGGRVGKEFTITAKETNIGRWDADNGIFPDIDLDEDDPEAKISRRHARIINNQGQYLIEDLGSTNGTFINRGRRLLPGKRHLLQNGDEIIVGKTFMKFHILR